jgi:hypothetical protein
MLWRWGLPHVIETSGLLMARHIETSVSVGVLLGSKKASDGVELYVELGYTADDRSWLVANTWHSGGGEEATRVKWKPRRQTVLIHCRLG